MITDVYPPRLLPCPAYHQATASRGGPGCKKLLKADIRASGDCAGGGQAACGAAWGLWFQGQQVADAVDGVIGDAVEHVAEEGLRVEADQLGGGDQAGRAPRMRIHGKWLPSARHATTS